MSKYDLKFEGSYPVKVQLILDQVTVTQFNGDLEKLIKEDIKHKISNEILGDFISEFHKALNLVTSNQSFSNPYLGSSVFIGLHQLVDDLKKRIEGKVEITVKEIKD